MHGYVPPAGAGQVVLSLHDLAAAIRAARVDAAAAFSSGIDRVREIGDRLKIAKDLAGRGRWSEFLKTCDLNDRTAQRYMQFAGLVAANPSPGTDLSSLSIKAAIKLLSPPKPPQTTPTPKPLVKSTKAVAPAKPSREGIHTTIIEAWLAASPADRTKAIDSVGLDAILAAIPESWLSQLEAHHADRRQSPAPSLTIDDDRATEPTVAPGTEIDFGIPADLSVPRFLDRRIKTNGAAS